MSLFKYVHADMLDALHKGYHSWLRETNKERLIFKDLPLDDSNMTRMYFLECAGFIEKPKRSVWDRFLTALSD